MSSFLTFHNNTLLRGEHAGANAVTRWRPQEQVRLNSRPFQLRRLVA